MFKRIMAPVDLAHVEGLRPALDCTADLAKHYSVPVVYVGVTSTAPSELAHNPEEFGQKLSAFAAAEAAKHAIETSGHTAIAHDPTIEIDQALMRAIDDTDADLVVMASHVPNVMDHIWPSNGGKLAEYAKCSVMVVRA
ncbi:universal stress protein [Pseudophaeobacter flagellatus]|uniref:universal stress protein n=1 Tax=Pseudophaeobacter flagellatus TaxID=2899119 RepID=UPI001E615326|nr:universal stress protein [Pseudophaeobacter flagellatus]MCD9148849.1 universal stress protein [Pseudophaeobacter flagellatus]